ncbi:MAG: hypothetical protein KUF72_07450 [Candidatus Thiodiazotropha sp. (ex Ctena orbiculata)]|nr:hypothetical protein [Candidatus Thiodiazotropha taylori]
MRTKGATGGRTDGSGRPMARSLLVFGPSPHLSCLRNRFYWFDDINVNGRGEMDELRCDQLFQMSLVGRRTVRTLSA